MITWKKISILGVCFFVVFACVLYALIVLNGKSFLTAQLKQIAGKEAAIGYCDVSFPFNLIIKDVRIPDLVRIEKVVVSPSILRFAFGMIAFNKITVNKPYFTFKKSAISAETQAKKQAVEAVSAKVLNSAEDKVPDRASAAGSIQPGVKRKIPNLVFKHLILQDGELEFIDQSVGDNGIKIAVKDINFELTNFYLPAAQPAVTNFKLTGNMPWRLEQGQEAGVIKAEGWFNSGKKDIAAEVKINDIDGVYLYPYYSHWVDLEKARIQQATLNFDSDIRGVNNNLIADCHLELANIVFKPRQPSEHEEKAEKLATTVIDIFKTMNQGKIVLDFTIKTRMDRPEFGFGDIRMAFEEKLNEGAASRVDAEDIFMLPARLWEGAVKTTVNISKSVAQGASDVSNQVRDFFAQAYKKANQQ